MLKLSSSVGAENRDTPKEPLTRFKKYRKYGFALTQAQYAYCPSCEAMLNAGPNYMPKRCEECGQLIDWTDYQWTPDKFIKYMPEGDNSEDDDLFAVD